MNKEQIDTFLAIYENQSLRKAAEQLYVEQGTVSKRIADLEDEMDVQLFYRSKGIRKVELSEYGEMFLPIAQQISALFDDAMNLNEHYRIKKYRIAATAALTKFYLLRFFAQFMKDHEDIEMFTQTEHSTEIYQMVENQIIDIGIVSTVHQFPHVIAEPLLSENLCIVCHETNKYAKTGRLKDLDEEYEIYGIYSKEYEIWHANAFPYSSRKKITIGALAMYDSYIDSEKDWLILPEYAARKWTSQHPDWIFRNVKGIPKRYAYIITHKYPKPGIKSTNELFISELKQYLQSEFSSNF